MSTDYKTMTTAEIREDYLRFFESKGCAGGEVRRRRFEDRGPACQGPSAAGTGIRRAGWHETRCKTRRIREHRRKS